MDTDVRRSTPAAIPAVLAGIAVMLAASIPWWGLIAANLKLANSFPWAAPAMAAYLCLYWRYCGGWGWPARTSEWRRRRFRARGMPAGSWFWAMTAGVLAVAAAVWLMFAWMRVVHVPVPPEPAVSPYPWITVVVLQAMNAAVSGIGEEAGFRGYMQSALEERAGPAVAIGTTTLLFGLVHFSHGIAYALPREPYYVAIGVIYGLIAWRTGSILPTMVIHSSGNALSVLLERKLGAPQPAPLIWQSGADAAFGRNVALGLACALASAWAFRRLRMAAQGAPGGTA